jgi:multiple sugar transport system substrate-binding protein
MAKTVLKGITWGHSRGITPLLAYAQRFSELNPDIEVIWKKRSLQEFADFPLEELAPEYDLLIIDHPWVGCASATGAVLPLDEHLPEEYLQDQQLNTVGESHASYYYNGHQWALAIDAATPAASYRADLLERNSTGIPRTWEQLLTLAKKGKVAVPGIPIDTLMNFYMFCIANGEEPFKNKEDVISEKTGMLALATMKELYSLLDKKMFNFNPIAVAEVMTKTDDYWYCPFAYCYSNYSRTGYADHALVYNDLVTFGSSGRFRGTLGGTGLAVSAFSKHPEQALQFAKEIVSGKCQSTFYLEHGGQPGHRSAWLSESSNVLCNGFFANVLPVMENGYMRPRYNGYLHFQDLAGEPIQKYLFRGGSAADTLLQVNRIYKQSSIPHLNSYHE